MKAFVFIFGKLQEYGNVWDAER